MNDVEFFEDCQGEPHSIQMKESVVPETLDDIYSQGRYNWDSNCCVRIMTVEYQTTAVAAASSAGPSVFQIEKGFLDDFVGENGSDSDIGESAGGS